MGRGRRNKRFETKSRALAKECNLEWEPLNRFRKENSVEIGDLMISGFGEGASASPLVQKATRTSLREKAAEAGVDWTNFLKFLEGLMPLIAQLMAICGA